MSEVRPQSAEERAAIAAELQEAGEPLLPIEKKLIAWSISLGLVLMMILIFATGAFSK